MNLFALSAFTDNNNIWMFHDGRHAVVLQAILVTGEGAGHVGRPCTSKRIRSDHGDEPPMPLSSIDRKRRDDPSSRCDETSAAEASVSHGAASDEPVAVLTALRPWKNDFR
jgi:hypothetical protein